MALELDIKMNKPITVGALIAEYVKMASCFLPCTFPDIEYEVKLNGKIVADSTHMLILDRTYLIVRYKGTDGEIWISAYDCPDNTGSFITVASSRNSQSILLTALFSISIAKLTDSPIVDEYQYWSNNRSSDWKYFMDSVRVKPSEGNISFSEYCLAFYDILPK